MADNYIQDMLKRVAAMQLEALNTLTSGAVDAVDYWPYEQETFPYFTNRLGPMDGDYDTYTEDIEQYNHSILMRLVVGHLTEGYKGEPQDLTYQYIGAVEDYFRQHPQLTTDAGSYTAVPDYLKQLTTVSGHTGLVVFNNNGIISNQLGCEFTLTVPFLREVY